MSHAHLPKRAQPAPLYERDIYAWVQQQVELLRARKLGEIDADNVAEELSDVGSNEYDKLESALRVLLLHMLKWDHQTQKRSRSWENSVVEQRSRAERQLARNPSLKSRLVEATSEAYRYARLDASSETDLDIDSFPENCPYDWDTLMTRELKR